MSTEENSNEHMDGDEGGNPKGSEGSKHSDESKSADEKLAEFLEKVKKAEHEEKERFRRQKEAMDHEAAEKEWQKIRDKRNETSEG
jgi:hypothetical protein